MLLWGNRQGNGLLPGRAHVSLAPWLSHVLEEEFVILITEVFPAFVVKCTAEEQGNVIVLLRKNLDFFASSGEGTTASEPVKLLGLIFPGGTNQHGPKVLGDLS